MSENMKKILKERGSRYGDFIDNAMISQEIKRALKLSYNQSEKVQISLAKEYVDNLAQKFSRFLCESPEENYTDTLQDIIGYSTVYLKFVSDRAKANIQLDSTKPLIEFSTLITHSSRAKIGYCIANLECYTFIRDINALCTGHTAIQPTLTDLAEEVKLKTEEYLACVQKEK